MDEIVAHHAADTTSWVSLADVTVHRLFGVGLTLQSAADCAAGHAAEQLHRAIEEIDAVITDLRAAVFDVSC